MSAATDSLLEMMTQNLLKVSSTFLIQQVELQEVKDRLNKEMLRVAAIQETLTIAAQEHQDAVLEVIQNYENLASELPVVQPPVVREAGAGAERAGGYGSGSHRCSVSSTGSIGDAAVPASFPTVQQVHMPPVASQPSVFKQAPRVVEDDDDDEGGIEYVANLQVEGGILGTMLVGSGDFVGTPSLQWHRSSQGAFRPIDGATELEYMPTADDAGATLQLEAVGPYGGPPVTVETAPIALNAATHVELQEMLRKGHAEFQAVNPQQEPRIILVTRKNVKVRSLLSRFVTTASTIYKQGYNQPLTVVVDPDNPNALELKMGPHAYPLLLDTQGRRDLATICVRMFAGPNCPTHDQADGGAGGGGDGLGDDEGFMDSEREAMDRSSPPRDGGGGGGSGGGGAGAGAGAGDVDDGAPRAMGDEGDADLKQVTWSDDEDKGEEDEFKPAMKVTIRSKEEVQVADTATLKTFSMGMMAPPKAGGSRRKLQTTTTVIAASSRLAAASAEASPAAAADAPAPSSDDAPTPPPPQPPQPPEAGRSASAPIGTSAAPPDSPAVAFAASFDDAPFDFASSSPAAATSSPAPAAAFPDASFPAATFEPSPSPSPAPAESSAGGLGASFDAGGGGGGFGASFGDSADFGATSFGAAFMAPPPPATAEAEVAPPPAASIAADDEHGSSDGEEAPAPAAEAAVPEAAEASSSAAEAATEEDAPAAAASEAEAEAEAEAAVAPPPLPAPLAAAAATTTEAEEALEPEHNLVVVELVNAHLKEKKLLSYQVVGELRIVPLTTGPTRACEVLFRLRNTNRIDQIKLNDRFVKTTQNSGEYLVQLPALSQPQPVPLIKYITSPRWRPIPLYVDATITPSKAAAEGGEGGEGGGVSLSATVEANPQLKMPLTNVTVRAQPGEHASEVTPEPPGTWDDAEGRLQWQLPKVLSKDAPVACTAALVGDAELLAASLGAQTLSVGFGCEGVTISGLELEVQLGQAGSPIARLQRRFAAGDYKVSPTLREAPSGE